MRLTKFQKEIIDSINSGEVKDIKSFIDKFCEVESIKPAGDFYGDRISISHEEDVLKPVNRKDFDSRLKEFICLWDRLSKKELIKGINKHSARPQPLGIFDAPSRPDWSIMKLIREYDKEIVPFPNLEDFVKRDYLTSEEYDLQETDLDRKKAQKLTEEAQRLTLRMSKITIAIGVISILASLFISLWTYTKERDVFIKNLSAFPDTTKVIIVNPEKITRSP